ncbi:MAG: hypothetical protein IPK42_05870 [Betaproteobacteria bacterium]|nr:hypothetical protein [Betaproteobacteria bacterium]
MTAVHQGAADLDGGGDYSDWTGIVRAPASLRGDGGPGAGLVFNYDHTDYDFSRPAAFSARPPGDG